MEESFKTLHFLELVEKTYNYEIAYLVFNKYDKKNLQHRYDLIKKDINTQDQYLKLKTVIKK